MLQDLTSEQGKRGANAISANAPALVPTAVVADGNADGCASFNFQVLLKPCNGAFLGLLQLTVCMVEFV
jgi:hypothetical protein